jgi:hypothetical protein
MFALPAMIAFYILALRGVLWASRPALLFVRPQLKSRAFFDHAQGDRISALCFDVRTPVAACHITQPRQSYPSKLSVAGNNWAD